MSEKIQKGKGIEKPAIFTDKEMLPFYVNLVLKNREMAERARREQKKNGEKETI
ncbi:hypothetical protein [Marinicella sp. W31]|uniref:hypothetical protein n=1 Tax=Marinicella sp. W31 TaxID=3023713 RepID=UPI003757194A